MSNTPSIPYGNGTWDAASLGNHRAVVEVRAKTGAVWAHIPWRRRDSDPEKKKIIVIDAATNTPIKNLARIAINREFGDLVFQPETAPGLYYLYFLPYQGSTRAYYPKIRYPLPKDTAEPGWLKRYHLTPRELPRNKWQALPRARVVEIQSIDPFHSFFPMEVIATREEIESLLSRYPDKPYLLFTEDRSNPIRMWDQLPRKWIGEGAGKPVHGKAARGEFYTFQMGVYATRRPVEDVEVSFSALRLNRDEIPGSAFRCFNLGGTDWTGRDFQKSVSVARGKVQPLWCGVQIPNRARPGEYHGTITTTARGMDPWIIPVNLEVSRDSVAAAGDNEPWRHSRLRWLDSKIALDDDIVAPFTPVTVKRGMAKEIIINILGRQVILGEGGFPESVRSYFAPEMTHLAAEGREILSGPLNLIVEGSGGRVLPWQDQTLRILKERAGAVAWAAKSSAGSLTMDLRAELAFDGCIEFVLALKAARKVGVQDIRLEIPLARGVAQYMMGLGQRGGYRPPEYRWKWEVANNQDSLWIGDVNAGLQCTLKDEQYSRPLNTNFYHLKPLRLPGSWHNEGQGGIRLSEQGNTVLLHCYSGPRSIPRDEVLYFNFRLLITPFKALNTRAQWATRFFHRFEALDRVMAAGANTINVHHATEINPYINYPFFKDQAMKAYVEEAHRRSLKVKIYYTVRELTCRAPELFALRSLGREVLSPGPGGGHPWLQEHLGDQYIPGWRAFAVDDLSVINSGTSRWHNFYLEGLDWLARNIAIDGIYIDDLAFGRGVMQRVRKILDRRRPGALIDLHSANQFNPKDGFANSANLYLEHFPYLDRLWFGEYFDYHAPPDYWLVELSGIPYGVMGEMLQDGGNPWRGMVFGMTGRLPAAGDPRPLWKLWDEFGIQDSRMIGYWVASCPVQTGHPAVPATVYTRQKRALVSLASWAPERVAVTLEVDWAALGIEPQKASITAPAIRDFQQAAVFHPAQEIPVEPGKGWLLVIQEHGPL